MKLIYGTKNKGKIDHMNHIIDGLGIEIVGLPDISEPVESGSSVLENAIIKAKHYYNILKRPIFSCDSGLLFEGVDPRDQPGKYIRRVNGKSLNDEEMIEYYSGLARQYGGSIKASYENAICMILDDETIIAYDGKELNSKPFLLVEHAHETRKEGFPLDALSVEIESNKHYYDLQEFISDDSGLEWGFRQFFLDQLSPIVTLTFKGYSPIKIRLREDAAPQTVHNFIHLIKEGYYKDKSLCRSVPGRLIQSGDTSLEPKAWTDDTPGYILKGEFNRQGYENPMTFKRGTIGMAMAADHESEFATAGSFFIMLRDETKLDSIVPAFGQVIDGIDIIEELNQKPVHKDYGYDSPIRPIPIDSIEVDTRGIHYPKPIKIGFDKLDPAD